MHLPEKDYDGRHVIKMAVTAPGNHYQQREIEICLSKHNGCTSYDWDNNIQSDVTCKIFDSNGVEITDPANEANAVRTQYFFAPNHDYDILGGNIRQIVTPNADIRVSAIGGAVDLGINYSKVFIPSLNLKYVSPGNQLETDGRASKHMKLTTEGVPVTTNKFEVNIYYPQGNTHCFAMSFEIFKA